MNYTECPHCGITWEGDEIPEGLMTTGNYTIEGAREVAAEFYGWTPENKSKFSINMVGIETPGYDGVSFWQCQKCKSLVNRFTGVILVKPVKEEEVQGRLRKRFEDGKAWARAHPVLTAMAKGFSYTFIAWYVLRLLEVI